MSIVLTSLGSRSRILIFAVIVCAAAVHLISTGYADWNSGADTAYVMGLLLLRFVSYLNTDEGYPRSPSAYDAMFIILAIAFPLFHFWQFRDGQRSAEAGALR